MPQINDDPRGREIYEFTGAGVDLRQDRSKVRLPDLVESIGTDGRFLGAIRPFPGFIGASVHGIPDPSPALSNIRLVKYAAIRKGLGNGILRGIVYLADNTQDKTVVGAGAASDYSWTASTQGGHENSYFMVLKNPGAKAHPHLDVSALMTHLVINGVATVATGTFSGTPLTAGQWGLGHLSNDEAALGGTFTTVYYRHDAGGTDPDTLADGYLKIRMPGWGVYFSYWDSALSSAVTVAIDDFSMLENSLLGTSLDEYDFACNDRYIYLVTGKRPSRAYWYDFAYTSWQTTNNEIENRYMGTYSTDSLDAFPKAYYPNRVTVSTAVDTPVFPDGSYQGALELVSRKHNIRSLIAIDSVTVSGGASVLTYAVGDKAQMPYYTVSGSDYLDGRWISDSVTYWGMQHWDTLRIWRTLKQDTSGITGLDLPIYGTLFLEREQNFALNSISGSELEGLVFDMGTLATFKLNPYTVDTALAQTLSSYDPYLHEVGRVPESKRIACLDGMTVVVARPFVFSDTEKEWSYTGSLSECIMYSSLVMGEVENFPVSNVWRPSRPGEVFHALRPVGDYIAAIGSAGVYRLLQNGTEMAGTTLARGVGGVSRWGNTSIGASLFFISKSGLKEVDMNTGSIRSLATVDRMIFDDRQWRDSLANVHMAYDAEAGVIILLNTTEHECIFLWESTGAVTTLVDCPWTFLTEGPDAKTGGTQRAYFVTDDGRVHAIDAGREASVKSMCAAGDGTDDILVNGTVAASSTTTVINVTADGTNNIPDDCKGFTVYFTSGANKGLSRTISVRNEDLQFTVSSALTNTPTVGDTFSIAPIFFRVTGPQIVGSGGQYDSFERKKVTQVAPAFSSIVGGAGDGTFRVGVYRRNTKLSGVDVGFNEIPDKCWGQVGAAGTQLYPYVESYYGNTDFELQALLVRKSLTGSESESRQE